MILAVRKPVGIDLAHIGCDRVPDIVNFVIRGQIVRPPARFSRKSPNGCELEKFEE